MNSHHPAASVITVPSGRKPTRKASSATGIASRLNSRSGALALAEEKGLLKGRRTLMIRGRMPEELVAAARQKTGITSDSELLEAALANLAVADDYAEWLFSQRATVDPDLDLEF